MSNHVVNNQVKWQEKWKWPLLGLAAFILFYVLPHGPFNEPRNMNIYITIISTAGVALGLRFIVLTGRFSMGQAAFMGIGGYMSAVLATRYDIDPFLGMLIGGISAAIVAIIFGYISLRLTGMYFAMVTIALTEVLVRFYLWWDTVTGGYMGISGLEGYHIDILGIQADFGFRNFQDYYYLILLITLVAGLVYWRLEHSRVGIAMSSTGQNDMLAQHIGINTTRYRVLAFSLVAFFTGAVGAFTVHYLHMCDTTQFGLEGSFTPILICMFGGIGSFFGPIIGAIALTYILEELTSTQDLEPILMGAILILVMIFLSRGLVSFPDVIKKLYKRIATRKKRQLEPAL